MPVLSFKNHGFRIDLKKLTNKTVTVYGQTEVTKDLYDAIESAESNGHQLYEFTQQIPINGELSEQVIEELSQRAAITESFNSEIIWAYGPEWSGDLQMWCQPRWTADHSALFGYTKKSHAPTLNMVETFYSKNGVSIK